MVELGPILIFLDHYLPGYKAGGPVRTVANLVQALGSLFTFRIVTSDRDFGDTTHYPAIPANTWVTVGHGLVNYRRPAGLSFKALSRLLRETPHSAVYLNSFFSPTFTLKYLLLRRLGLVPDRPVLIAPRGEFSPGALAIKRSKKLPFLFVARSVGLYRGVHWHASTSLEASDIRRWFGQDAPVFVALDVPSQARTTAEATLEKTPGAIRLVFLSRLSRKKNLHFALELLQGLEGDVQLDIYGPQEDPVYWQECEAHKASLGPNIQVNYRGMVQHDEVSALFGQYHLFLFPTLGENFGHVILEALQAGCPVLTSDQTPWEAITKWKAGWVLPLSDPDGFKARLRQAVTMNETEFSQMRGQARQFAMHCLADEAVLLDNRKMFHALLAPEESPSGQLA